MGIKSNFRKFLEEKFPEAFSTTHISTFANQRIAVDIMGVIHRYKCMFGAEFQRPLMAFCTTLKNYSIELVFVFDGDSPPEKAIELAARRKKREDALQKIEDLWKDFKEMEAGAPPSDRLIEVLRRKRPNLPHSNVYAKLLEDRIEDFKGVEIVDENHLAFLRGEIFRQERQIEPVLREDVRQILNACLELGITCIQASGEAETTCCWLCINKKVDAVLSDDSDLIPLGCCQILSKFKQETVSVLNFQKLLQLSKLTREQIVDWAILCGTDFNASIPKIGVVRAFNLINLFKSLDNLFDFISENGFVQYVSLEHLNNLNFKRIRQIFDVQQLDSDGKYVQVSS